MTGWWLLSLFSPLHSEITPGIISISSLLSTPKAREVSLDLEPPVDWQIVLFTNSFQSGKVPVIVVTSQTSPYGTHLMLGVTKLRERCFKDYETQVLNKWSAVSHYYAMHGLLWNRLIKSCHGRWSFFLPNLHPILLLLVSDKNDHPGPSAFFSTVIRDKALLWHDKYGCHLRRYFYII